MPPTRQSRLGWPPTTARTSTRPCDSTIAPMEHHMCSNRRRSRIDHPNETTGRVRVSHYQPRDNQRKERGSVHFREREDSSARGGTSQLSTTMTHPSCDCDDTDVDTIYRMCCITVGNSPSFSAATLFDTGAHTSFFNREVAAWIELQAKVCKASALGPRDGGNVSIVGSNPIY